MRQVSSPVFVPTKTHELIHRMSGKGLAAHYDFSRQPSIYGDQMVSVQVTLSNASDQKIENIHLDTRKLPVGMKIHVFNPIGNWYCFLGAICATSFPLFYSVKYKV